MTPKRAFWLLVAVCVAAFALLRNAPAAGLLASPGLLIASPATPTPGPPPATNNIVTESGVSITTEAGSAITTE